MCRFVAYHGPPISLADLITRPTHSIIHQSHHAKERSEPLNGDGFGLAWYADGDGQPALFKDVSPAWNNRNLIDLARVVTSRGVLAHVRAATQGLSVMRSNCHPFAYEQFAFMHNGNVADFADVRRDLLRRLSDEAFRAIRGTTDSEHAFALWLDHWRAAGDQAPLARMELAMRQTLTVLGEFQAQAGMASTLNLAVTDGTRFVASRVVFGGGPANTLYWTQGEGLRWIDGVRDVGNAQDSAVLVASEPLFAHERWHAVPTNSLLTVDAGQVAITPL